MAGIILNEDFENFMVSNPPEKMTEDGLREQIDHYAGKQVSTLIFCGNGMRAMFDSHSFEPLWKDMEEHADGRVFFRGREVLDKPLPVKSNALNCKRLYTNVENPFMTRIEYARNKGCKVFAGMRMNDVHWADDPDFLMNSDFWREHPELRCASYRDDWPGQALDYSRSEVRNHYLALVHEYLERFDFDGIELDWMRTPPHLRPGFEVSQKDCITDFIRETRKIADESAGKRKHDIKIFVRVPSRPEDALRNGFDVPLWIREKLIDHLTVSNYFAATDFDPPVELWRMIVGNDFPLSVGLDINCMQYPGIKAGFRNTAEIVFGFTSSFLYRGADSIYLFNHMDGRSAMYDKKQFENVLKLAGSRETAEVQRRRHVVTFTDYPARALGTCIPSRLPFKPRNWAPVRLNVGGATRGRDAFAILGIDKNANAALRLNTYLCEPAEIPEKFDAPTVSGGLRAWKIPDGVLHDGDNVIEVDSPDWEKITVDWCEILIEKECR